MDTSYSEEKERLQASIKQRQNSLKSQMSKGTQLLTIGNLKPNIGKSKGKLIIGVAAVSTALLVGGLVSRIGRKKRKKKVIPLENTQGYYQPVQYPTASGYSMIGKVKSEIAAFLVSLIKEAITVFIQELPNHINSKTAEQETNDTEKKNNGT